MAGDGRAPDELALVALPDPCFEGASEALMQLGTLAGKQIVIQRFTQQCVAKAETGLAVGEQDLFGHRLAQAGLERV